MNAISSSGSLIAEIKTSSFSAVQLGLIVTSIEVNFIPSVFKKLSISFFRQ